MKLPEEPTKKVREILAIALQCPGYKIDDKGLYEIKKLCDCLDELERIINDIEDWGVVTCDEPLLKLIKELKVGERRE